MLGPAILARKTSFCSENVAFPRAVAFHFKLDQHQGSLLLSAVQCGLGGGYHQDEIKLPDKTEASAIPIAE